MIWSEALASHSQCAGQKTADDSDHQVRDTGERAQDDEHFLDGHGEILR